MGDTVTSQVALHDGRDKFHHRFFWYLLDCPDAIQCLGVLAFRTLESWAELIQGRQVQGGPQFQAEIAIAKVVVVEKPFSLKFQGDAFGGNISGQKSIGGRQKLVKSGSGFHDIFPFWPFGHRYCIGRRIALSVHL